ncbi:beta galactosidase jelly roll domain-containing protein [Mucilaginibacter sp. JRF]|uniref:glycoside hydrolase family 2 protein n=1 Tax=Mucilaginibacter sp. JRF TaxID=2780088 RepID=UPI00187E83FA|nr:sugar-binding domain-containing protein [Mucilaginibacter sp. JRF]MBE9585819.1 beta galactosidase jelly roll domain-containing protein [Mucilaginibacter sp. JRF]
MKKALLPAIALMALLLACFDTHAQDIKLKWKVFPADEQATANKVLVSGYQPQNAVDAVVPGTVFYSYVKAGVEKDPDYAGNIYQVDKAKYNKPYWYRTSFKTPSLLKGKRLRLNFNGVHKRAEVYINGKHIGTIQGIVERGLYDVTDLLNTKGENTVAVLVITPDPTFNLANRQTPTYLSSGSWDWMPAVPGLNSGLTDTVALTLTGPVTIQDPWVSTDLPEKDLAKLTVQASLKNTTNTAVNGHVKVTIQPGNISFNGPAISIKANSASMVNYNANEFKQLAINNPKLWWPNGYGAQILYTLKLSFVSDGGLTETAVKRFGIRKVTTDTTALKGPMRVYVNGQPILLKGGNWGMSDYMLKVRGKDYEPRIRLHKEMNFNTIRNWTGEVTDEAFYDYCDQYGIMVWDDFWLNNFGPVDSVKNFELNAIEKVKKFRHHPSIVIWCGANEGLPGGDTTGALSMAIKKAINENDAGQRLYVPRSNAGPTNPNFSIHGGSRMLSGSGNWSNTDAKTYFTDPKNGYLFSHNSWGMRSELGMATFVNIESFKKFMSPEYWVAPTEQAVDSKTNEWAQHYFSTAGELGGGADPVKYIRTINSSYGPSASLEEFCKKAQLLNVEGMKAMFEAWNDHMWNDASGMLIWMSQSAYPSMIWQTYDYYYDLTGAYFGAKYACEPIHIQWSPATNSIKVINNTASALNNYQAVSEFYGADGKPLAGYSTNKTASYPANAATEAFNLFSGKDTTKLPELYFVRLKLYNGQHKLVSENFYWAGKKYLDYKALNAMPSVSKALTISKATTKKASNTDNTLLTYTIANTSKMSAAFGIRVQLLDDKGKQILPAIISDSYFTMMQNETKQINVEVKTTLLKSGYHLVAEPFNK